MLRYEEGVLHVAGRMVGGEVHLRKHVEVVLHLWSVGQYESHAGEDIDDLVGDDGQWVARAELYGVGCARQVEALVARLLGLALFAQLVDALGGHCLQFINFHAHRLFLVGGYVAEVVHQGRDLTLAAEVFQS